MLQSLNIKNIAVIQNVNIDFHKGLHVLTGETGAGKSILIDSINMILGERTSKESIRYGTDEASVSALFTVIDNETKQKLTDLGISVDDDALLFQRSLSKEKTSTARINGQLVTMSMMKELSKSLVNIHGQHDNQFLFNKKYHLLVIDKIANNDIEKQEYKTAFDTLKRIRRELLDLQTNEDEKKEKIEFLQHEIQEIEEADIAIGEIDKLNARKQVILHSEKIIKSLNLAYNTLNGSEIDNINGAIQLLSQSGSALEENEEHLPALKQMAQQCREMSFQAEDILNTISSLQSEIDYNVTELEKVEERLNILYLLSEKYGKTEADILDYLKSAKTQLEKIQLSEQRLSELSVQYDNLFEEVVQLADKLSKTRKDAAKDIEKNIMQELAFLNMPNIQFVITFEKDNLSSKGYDDVEFLISTNPGQPPKPLIKIASGGELSRIMLAIKTVIADKDIVQTLIFDEIDTGISGNAAIKVGEKLKEVAKTRQVICVTHLAQIAAFADYHYVIEKEVKNNHTFTQVQLLNDDGRAQELARIIGGTQETTEKQIDSAQELLKYARNCS